MSSSTEGFDPQETPSSEDQDASDEDGRGYDGSPDLSSPKRNLAWFVIGSAVAAFLSFLGVLFQITGSLDWGSVTSLLKLAGASAVAMVVVALLIFGFVYWLNTDKIDAAARKFATEFIKENAIRLNTNVENLDQNIDRLNRDVEDLNERIDGRVQNLSAKVNDLKEEIQRLDDDIVKEFTGDTEGTRRNRGILNRMSTLMDRLSIADEEMYFYQEDPDNTEHHFIHDDQALTQRYNKVRILGTMMGVTGDGYNVCQHIRKLVETRLDEGEEGNPFNICDLAVPVGPEVETSKYSLCARRFALQLLSTIHDAYDRHGVGFPNLTVRISFLSPLADVFPALQIWDDDKCLIIPSVGKYDRTGVDVEFDPVAKALPVALGIRRSIDRMGKNDEMETYKLGGTLKRIVNVFDEGYFNNSALTHRSLNGDVVSRVERYQIDATIREYTSDYIKRDIGTNLFDTSRFAEITTKEEVEAISEDLDDLLEPQASDSSINSASGVPETP